MDTIIPAQHPKVVKIPKHDKKSKDQVTKHSNKSKNKEKISRKQHRRHENIDSSSGDNESTDTSEESEKSTSESDTEASSDTEVKTSESKKVKQKHRRIKRAHNPNVEFIEQPTEKDLKNVLMKEIDEEIDLNRRLSRNRRRRSSKRFKEKSLKESFVSKLKHVKESFRKKIVLIPAIIIIALCVIGCIAYYINKKHPGFFNRVKETITRKKHSEKTEKIFN